MMTDCARKNDWLERFGLSAGVFLLMSLLAFKKAHPILIIALSAGLGMILGYAFGL